MQVKETLSEGLKHAYTIIVPAGEIETHIAEKLGELRNTVQIKGFRPGKAPLDLLRKRFEGSIMGEVIEETVNRSSQQALLDEGVRPAMQPQIEIEKFENGADLEYKMSIEALPDIEPADPKSLSLTRVKAEVADDAVEDSITRLAEQQKSFADAKANHAAALGDAVRIDFIGRIDGEPFEGGSSTDHQLELGSQTFLPGFEDQLVGAIGGDKVEVNVSFPAEYPGEHVAGKDAIFEVEVKQVLVAEPIEVDDGLAARLGMSDLAALRAAVREQIQRDYNGATRIRLKREILDQLADGHQFAVPPTMVEREFEAIWQQIENDMERSGDGWDDADQTEEEARDEYRKIADRRVRLGLLLSEIGQRNNIVVPQEELNRAVMEQARRHPGQEQQVFDYFRNNPQAMNELQAPLYEDKVIDFLIEMAEVTDKVVPADELLQQPDPATPDKLAKPKKKAASKKAPAKKAKASSGKSKSKSDGETRK